MVLFGIGFVLSSIASLVDGRLKLRLLALAVAVFAHQFAMLDSATRRFLRPFLWILGTLYATGAASMFVDDRAPDLQAALLVLVTTRSATFIVMLAVKGLTLLRSAQPK